MHETGETQQKVRNGLRVVICDRRRTWREALRTYLATQSGIASVALAANADEAVRLVRLGTDVLVLDVLLNGDSSSFDVLEAVRNLRLRIAVLMLSEQEDTEPISRALDLGAAGFCTKHASGQVLYDAVRTVARGDFFLPDTLAARVVATLNERRRRDLHDQQQLLRLTPREREVLRLLAEGRRRDDIARHLGVTPNTARTHLSSLLDKLDVHSQVAAAALGRRLLRLHSTATR